MIPTAVLTNKPFGRIIENLEEGTTYYLRPFYQEQNKIIYCKETSFQTVGKDIKLTAEVSPEKDKIVVTYSVIPKGTYHLTLNYHTTIDVNKDYVEHPDLGYISDGSGTKEADVKLLWTYIMSYNAVLEDINTGIRYLSTTHRGGRIR